jgi:hypothetical protein
MRKWILKAALVGGVFAMLLVGLVALANAVRDRARDLDRFSTPFAAIECTPAPPLLAGDFLSEVQYLGDVPGRLHLLDADTPRRLAEAFARHPWVEQVERVEVTPARRVQVQLRYRVAVLAVRWKCADPGDVRSVAPGYCRAALDAHGVLLPAKPDAPKLPTYDAGSLAPAGAAGTPFGAPTVQAAARCAGLLAPHQDALHLASIEAMGDLLVWHTDAKTRVMWGSAPGSERASEAPASKKVQRLLEFCRQQGSLDSPDGPFEYDLRPPDGALRRKLPRPAGAKSDSARPAGPLPGRGPTGPVGVEK